MTDESTATVIKSHDVKMAAGRRLAGAAGGGADLPASTGAAARIVRQDDDGALVEVTCACGRQTLLHCAYAPEDGTG